MTIIKYYLLIGLATQIVITTRRFIKKECNLDGVFDTFIGGTAFLVALVVGAAINIALWPMSIVYEVKHIKYSKS